MDAVMKQFSYNFEVNFGPISEESFPEISSIGFAFGLGCFKQYWAYKFTDTIKSLYFSVFQ